MKNLEKLKKNFKSGKGNTPEKKYLSPFLKKFAQIANTNYNLKNSLDSIYTNTSVCESFPVSREDMELEHGISCLLYIKCL